MQAKWHKVHSRTVAAFSGAPLSDKRSCHTGYGESSKARPFTWLSHGCS
jgi:hypothetical protein